MHICMPIHNLCICFIYIYMHTYKYKYMCIYNNNIHFTGMHKYMHIYNIYTIYTYSELFFKQHFLNWYLFLLSALDVFFALLKL